MAYSFLVDCNKSFALSGNSKGTVDLCFKGSNQTWLCEILPVLKEVKLLGRPVYMKFSLEVEKLQTFVSEHT